MASSKSLLLAGTAFLALAAAPAHAGMDRGTIVLTQASSPHEGENEKKDERKPPQKGAEQPRRQSQPPKPGQAQPKPSEKPAAQQQPQHETPKAAQQPPPQPQHQAEPRHEEKQQERRPETQKPEAKPSTAVKPAPEKESKPAASERKPEQKPAAAEEKQEERRQETQKPGAKPSRAAKPTPENESTPAASERKPEQRPAAVEQKPAAQPLNESKPAAQEQHRPQAPAAQSKPEAPAAQTPSPQKPAAQSAPATRTPPNKAETNAPTNPSAQNAAPAVALPQKPQSAQQFILPKNGKPTVTLQDVRKDRHETREGGRTVITEGDRTIVKEDNRVIIRHNEAQRFAVGARNVNVERHGNETSTVIVRPDGDSIINVTDENGRLIRRLRRERGGREIVIIDERSAGPRDIFVDLPPPVVRIPRDRYIVELDRARPEVIYDVLDAPPVERVEHPYTIAQVRYSAPLRERMPRVDLDINFETGSWQLTPDQIDKLKVVAQGLNRAIDRNPREVFLIEGHSDAVGSAEDNLSLSDRRAESIAVALAEQFHVPPENLITQGYGEQDLKVQTEGASRANRRVSVRRITPLIDQQAAR
jgi:outer membrane protein OmpA-like peptidoglycan-associated protein